MDADQTQGLRQITAEIPVAEVTLLEDRALVVRRGIIELPPGRSQLVIQKVAPVLVDKTLAATLSLPRNAGPDQAELAEDLRVRSVSIRRWRITREQDRPADLAQLRATKRDKQLELANANARIEQLSAEHASVEQLLALTLQEINEDVSWGAQAAPQWGEQLDLLDAKLRELGLEVAEIKHANQRLTRALQDLQTLEAASSSLDSEVTAELTLELINPDPVARELELGVDYLVPGALWRPWHSARLIEPDAASGPRVEFQCEGAVWQSTGEDWNDVQLIFSTERPSLGVKPPTLTTDTLRFRKKSSTVEVEAREQMVNTAGLGADPGAGPSDGPARSIAEDDLPGIDDGGEAIELRGRAKATIPADGRPYRVPIFSFESPAKTALVCTPELDASVILRSRQHNAATHPLLAGPVDLVRNSGLVGRTSLLFIAPGERFELGWGPDSSLRVHRKLEELEHERRMMSSWTRKPRRVTVKLSNLSPRPATIEVKERIAVSEVEKVEVELTEASHGATPDADGFVTWEAKLRGFGREALELTWVLVVHDDVVGM
ncbi:Aspartate ammonia-lyase [Enhygromyxa salina]|uniref:Aspartate ammonia-lyase n=1 Tax=Enhygromyxa salina TaxID=215803 RepID=A0A0C1ZXU4_9BACT|nr:mucoidy inhibitor MuiA family protein [Enhygromyxa salina]KIG16058.1 Aspartate ammonia-lyase [Enhygromyxa salina]